MNYIFELCEVVFLVVAVVNGVAIHGSMDTCTHRPHDVQRGGHSMRKYDATAPLPADRLKPQHESSTNTTQNYRATPIPARHKHPTKRFPFLGDSLPAKAFAGYT